MPTRRQFIRRASTGTAVAVLAPQTSLLDAQGAQRDGRKLLRGGKFGDGVISADPSPNGIALWTRVTDTEGTGRVLLEVAREKDFKRVVARQGIRTSGGVNHAVKAQLRGLRAHTEYFYRFATATGESQVGRFRTAAPEGSNEPVRFAYWSCQDYTHGYYNAHEAMVREDLDFVVCLGDYIYAETYHSVEGGTGVRDDEIGSTSPDPDHLRDAITLADYREKYSLYRSDAALRKLHAAFPMVYVPDDHEVQDNYAGTAPGGGLDPSKRYSTARRKAAKKAFYESNPRFPNGTKLYSTHHFGKTVDLFVMDQRTYRADQPCGDAISPPCADLDQPRAFLGTTQMNWLKRNLSRSKASWKILANEVTIMPTMVLGGAYVQYDSWQGYPQEREELLTHIADEDIQDVVFVTGDIHTFIAGDVRRDMGRGESVAIELVGGSISSSGFGETDLPAGNGVVIPGNDANPSTDPALIDTLRGLNPWVDQADFDHHGFGVVEASRTGLKSRFVRMETVKRRSTKRLTENGFRYDIDRGQTSIKGVNGPAAA
jgi:alkaline phosphatase D